MLARQMFGNVMQYQVMFRTLFTNFFKALDCLQHALSVAKMPAYAFISFKMCAKNQS